MPPFDTFSHWLEAISGTHWVLPTIGRIQDDGWPHPWTLLALDCPREPFVQLWTWNHTNGNGLIRTRLRGANPAYQMRRFERLHLKAVYRRFEQLVQHGQNGPESCALINSAYNKLLRNGDGHLFPYCWQQGAYPGLAGFEECPNPKRLCPYLAPLMFLFCGSQANPANAQAALAFHNDAAHEFAIQHGLEDCVP